MKRPLVFLVWIFVAVSAFLPGPAARSAIRNPAERIGWWVEHFGVQDEGDAARTAHEVLERVLAASDIRAHRRPRLVVIKHTEHRISAALPDGNVVISLALIGTLRNSSPSAGRDRLAFVLGHELAHLANDDAWAAAAFSDVDAASGKTEETLMELFRRHGDFGGSPMEELRADEQGLVTMSIAGFDPEEILDPSFLEIWKDLSRSENGTHPDEATRAAYLGIALGRVRDLLQCHDMGVRLYEIGRYRDALALLEEFAQEYPCGQVLNTLGLCHYRIAERALASCDPEAVAAFFPSPLLCSSVDLGPPITPRGTARACREESVYRRAIEAAADNFEAASRRLLDPWPARLNLGMTLMLDQRPGAALGLVSDAEDDGVAGPLREAAINLRAAAVFWWGETESIDTADRAIKLLDRVPNPGPATLYNRARILEARGREQAARTGYRLFLQHEVLGPRARHARRILGIPAQRRPSPTPPPASWTPIGPLGPALQKAWAAPPFTRHDLGALDGWVVTVRDRRALVLSGSVELVEQPPNDFLTPDQRIRHFGPPVAVHHDLNGSITYVWKGHAAEFRAGRCTRVIVFGT